MTQNFKAVAAKNFLWRVHAEIASRCRMTETSMEVSVIRHREAT